MIFILLSFVYNKIILCSLKDKVVDYSLRANVSSCHPANMASYSFTAPPYDHFTQFSSEGW